MPFKTTRTAQDVADEVKRTFGDEAGVQITNSDIFRWVTAAQIEIVSKNKVLKAVGTTVSVADQYEYNLNTTMDIQYIQSIQYKGVKLKYMSFQDAETFITSEDPNRTSKGTPEYWWDWGNTIQFYPTPNVGGESIKVYYYPLPTSIDALSDPLSLPDNYFNRIIDYVLARAYELDENFQAHQAKISQFGEELLNMSEDEDTQSVETYHTITVRAEDM